MIKIKPTLAAAAACLLSMLAIAAPSPAQQTAKVLIRLVPKPNETFKFAASQETEMDVTVAGADQKANAVPRKLVTKTLFAFTERTGPRKDSGEVDADITYDKIFAERTMDGKPEPMDDLGSELVGRTITFTHDREGRITNVRVPGRIEVSGDELKEMMNSLYGNLPASPMSVGESAAVPFSMPLPIPAPGPEPLNITGQTKYRLLALEGEGDDRIARMDQTVEAGLVTTMDIPLPKGSAKVSIQFNVSGSGALELNLGRGIMKSNQMIMTIKGDMTLTSDAPDVSSQSLKLLGVVKMTSTGTL